MPGATRTCAGTVTANASRQVTLRGELYLGWRIPDGRVLNEKRNLGARKPHVSNGIQLDFDVGSQQLFFIAYQCQHCHSAPEGFLLRRNGWRFSLDGRSPMEVTEVPRFIPKKEQNLYRDVLVARHGGKNLAAVFYLRTFIEQFARRITGIGIRDRRSGDEIMDEYARILPAKLCDQRQRRATLVRQLREKLRSGEVVVIEIV